MADIEAQNVLSLFTQAAGVTNNDQILVQSAEGNDGNRAVKVTAEVLRAYLNSGFEITVSEDGYLVIGGKKTDSKAEGITPMLRRGSDGIECSTDNGNTWITLAKFTDLGLLLGPFTQEEYDNMKARGLLRNDCYYSIWEEEV